MDEKNIRIFLQFIKKTIPLGSNIIELGSGHGTRELVKNYKVYSIEQNKKWIGYVPESNYIYAPLKGNWYDPDIIKSNIPLKYSAILIDGPQGKGRMGFMENLSLFSLLNEVPIIIDDANRNEEKELLIALSSFLKKPYSILENDHGTAYIMP